MRSNQQIEGWGNRVMVFKATFNNISAISWRSVLLVEKTGVPGENHRPTASHWQTNKGNIVEANIRGENANSKIYQIVK